MKFSFVPPPKRKKQSLQSRQTSRATNNKSILTKVNKSKNVSPTHPRVTSYQPTIAELYGHDITAEDPSSGAIEATGDKLINKADRVVRFALQNINGLSLREGLQVMPEVATIGALNIDFGAFTETNIHWSKEAREQMSSQLYSHLGTSRIVCASDSKGRREEGYQPGGSMLTAVGPQSGRITQTGSDPWGRYSWMLLRGERDEGLLVISAYRVSQEKGTISGPTTAYSRQVDRMITEGDTTLDPRSRILKDLRTLITSYRAKGYRPILMMDANDEWVDSKNGFAQFVKEMSLVDPLYNKFCGDGLTSTTYARGSRRIDYILVDSVLESSIKRIGTLGLHEGIISDHVMLYMDCDEEELFRGHINRPVMNPSREFVIEHADKAEKFLKKFKEYADKKKFESRAEALLALFKRNGPTKAIVQKFNTLDTEIKECILSAASTVAKKKFGYQRSPALTGPGLELHFWKAVLSSKARSVLLGKKQLYQAKKCNIPIEEIEGMNKREVRVMINKTRRKLWTAQKQATANRVEWLEKNAQDIARAAGELDWRKKMKDMQRNTVERAVNRKLSMAIKGSHRGLDWIEVPRYDWYYSHSTKEVYHYDNGVFEAHAPYTPQIGLQPSSPTIFYSHHHLKVLPNDAVRAEVHPDGDHLALSLVYLPSPLWREVNDPTEIESTINGRNKRHLQQASIEPGRAHDPIMQQLADNNGINSMVDSIKDGSLTIDAAADETIQAWLSALQQTATNLREAQLPPMASRFTQAEFQGAFKSVAERTTSSPSGLHYTLWKVLASCNAIAKWMSLLMSLPFMFGFANERWTTMVDVMLEKKRGVRKIHQLRIIGILEADFNIALKILFSRNLMAMAEKTGLDDDQWGCRKNRTSIDAAMRKLLTFEYGRYMYATIGTNPIDLTACFDRMRPEITGVVAQVHGTPKEVVKAKILTMKELKRYIKTALGTSKVFYTNTPGDPLIQGEVQGKADVASLWTMVSSSILMAHRQVYQGIDLPSVVGKSQGIEKNNDGYVDDIDVWAATLENDPEIAEMVMVNLTVGTQSLANLFDVVSQSTAFHKCFCQVLAWKLVDGLYEIDYNTTHDITLKDSVGAPSKIRFVKADQPNPGLGFHACPDGNQAHQFQARVEKIDHVCKAAQSICLDQREAASMLNTRLHTSTAYVMRLTQFTSKQCHELDVKVNRTFLPLMKINRSTPRALVHGPLQFGGMNILQHQVLQDQWNLQYFIQSLRWDKIIAQDIITVLDAFQLVSGFVSPVLSCPDIAIDYLSHGLIPHIRQRLKMLEGEIAVEDAWRPYLQREGDDSLMELFAGHIPPNKRFGSTYLTPKERRRANEYRMSLGIICVSDLATLDGKYIPLDRLSGNWRALPSDQVKFIFPNLPPQSNKNRVAFKKALRLTLCTTESPWKRTGYYKLDNPLGAWFANRPRHTRHDSYIDEDRRVYLCDFEGTYGCNSTGTPNFLEYNGGSQVSLPDNAIPYRVRDLGDNRIWIWNRVYMPFQLPEPASDIRVHEDNFVEQEGKPLYVVSDCAVKVADGRAAGAWHIYHDRKNRRRVTKTVDLPTHSHSYRGELETFYHALQDATSHLQFPHKIIQCMDNEGGLTTLDTPITGPTATMGTDMDLAMAYKHLADSCSQHQIERRWVMGHADLKKKDEPETITPLEHVNIDCDLDAGDRMDLQEAPQPFKGLPGYKAMLKIGGQWVTTHFRENVGFASTASPTIQYAIKRLKITEDIFHTINWYIVGRVRSSHRIHRVARTSKMLYRWLPVGANWRQCNLDSDRCPCCGVQDETFEHLLACPHPDMTTERQDSIHRLKEDFKKLKLPPAFSLAFIRALKVTLYNSPIPTSNIPSITAAYAAQERIGYYNMAVGLLANEWTEVLATMNVEQPQSRMEDVLSLLWDNMCEQMWKTRCNIQHSPNNKATPHELQQLQDKLLWYLRHQDEVLDYRHRFLTQYTPEDVERWSRATRRAKLESLNNASQYYKTECTQRAQGQTTIFTWLNKYTRLRNGRMINTSANPNLSPMSGQHQISEDDDEIEWHSSDHSMSSTSN